MDNIVFGEPVKQGGFTVVKTCAADGFKKITDCKNNEEFIYEDERWIVEKEIPKRGGSAIIRRISDGKRCRMTPFTIVKPCEPGK